MLSFTGEVRFKIIAVTYTQQSSKTPVTLEWNPTEDNLDFGADFTAPEFNCSVAEAQSSVVFESSNPGLVDYVDGEWKFTKNVSGTAFINASIPETDATYSATPATYTLTVNPKPILGVITATFNGNDDYNPATATTTITVKSTAIEPTGLWKCVTSLNAINDVTPYMLAGYKKSDES